MPVRPHTTDGLSTSAPITPAKYPGLGSGHTRLRLVSGGGRKVSPGRETVPLRGEDPSPQHRRLSAKRQHSEDCLQPRKRSDSRSPLNPIDVHQQPIGVSPASSVKRNDTTPRKGSNGTVTPVRRSSVVHQDADPVVYNDAEAAIEATKQRVGTRISVWASHPMLIHQIMEARIAAKRIKTELTTIRKQGNRGSLTRSPQRRNITVSGTRKEVLRKTS